jgi:hypothetical protein
MSVRSKGRGYKTSQSVLTYAQQRLVYATLFTLVFMGCSLSNPETAFVAQQALVGSAVVVYDVPVFRGTSQSFEVGVFRADREDLSQIGNDTISSLKVAEGYKVKVCQSEGDGQGTDGCETYTAGNYPTVGLDNIISLLVVSKVSPENSPSSSWTTLDELREANR